MLNTIHVGVDDTDSPRGGCTTYVAALLVTELENLECEFIDYPNLIRLNPNVPWKTRGNGAVSLRFKCPSNRVEEAVQRILRVVEENSDLGYANTDPAVSILVGEVPQEVTSFSFKAIRNVVSVDEALQVASTTGVKTYPLKGRRGIVGSLAALGEVLKNDHTFELIAYRSRQNIGTPRKVDYESVVEMDGKTRPFTYNNYDPEKRRILITPHGADPILYGIRGETPQIVLEASRMLAVKEPVERWVIFRTNHGTDMHYSGLQTVKDLEPHHPVTLEGVVAETPKTIQGGHVFFTLADETGTVECAAYEPTGSFKDAVKQLNVGDSVKVYGGVKPPGNKHPLTVNLEKLEVKKIYSQLLCLNPKCPMCGRRMESAGKGQGYRCKKCKTKQPSKIWEERPRALKPGLYIPPPRAQRHLTKPITRYGLEKNGCSIELTVKWHYP
ncbi:MAG: tRNA(Ile)(2)-agmatinylcytidine synthase [Candidatus Bathyarchaeia archaeon]